jgi:phosphoglycerol transferase MdoB-like AlkP superfamily enzyme
MLLNHVAVLGAYLLAQRKDCFYLMRLKLWCFSSLYLLAFIGLHSYYSSDHPTFVGL